MPAQEKHILPSTRWQAFWGTLPFLAFGIVSMIGKVDYLGNFRGSYADLAFYLLTLVGLGAGWIRGFPLWTYSYLGWASLFALWWTDMHTGGLQLFGYSFTRQEAWGWRIWIPFGITVLIALLWTRSFAPLKKFLSDVWNDWTRLSLTMFAFVAFEMLIFDENHSPHLLLLMAVTTIVIAAGAWLFLRSSSLMGRVLSLVISFFAAVALTGVSYLTWDWRAYYGLPAAENWRDNLGIAPIGVAFLLLILFFPMLIALLRRFSRHTPPYFNK